MQLIFWSLWTIVWIKCFQAPWSDEECVHTQAVIKQLAPADRVSQFKPIQLYHNSYNRWAGRCTWQNGQIQSLFPLDRANKQTKNMCKAQPESGLTYCVWESVSGQSTSTSMQLEQLIRVAFNSAKINWDLPSIPPRSIEIRLQFWPDQLKSTSDNQMGSVKTLVSCRQRHPTSR
jgi:hypothetical protein